MLSLRSIGVLIVLAAPMACGQAGDPAVPCEALDLGEARSGMVASSAEAPVLVLSDSPRPFVILRSWDDDLAAWTHRREYLDRVENRKRICDGETCRDLIDPIEPGSRVLLTGSGRYVVAIDFGTPAAFRSWRVRDDGELDPGAKLTLEREGPNQLLASLRDSDTVIVRDATPARRLRAVNPMSGTYASEDELAPGMNLLLVAVGNRHVVGREVLDDTHERLVLVPVDRDEGDLREATPLVVAPAFSQVELTADDGHVIATSGEGEDAETFVFDVATGALLDRFLGAVVTGAHKLESMSGMRASSPDGSHVAYRTPSGALALRDLESASSCLVRSSSAGDHNLAGFAADGMLYLQADADVSNSHLFAFDTRERRLTALDPTDARGHHLAGVPSRLADRRKPWAIGVRNGTYSALQGDAPALGIGAQAPVFVPRDDDGLWMADVRRGDSSRQVSLRRLVPRRSPSGRGLDFGDVDGRDGLVQVDDLHGDDIGKTLATLFPSERPCLATGAPGGWAYQCGGNATNEFMAVAPMPSTENPGDGMTDSEVPDPSDSKPPQDGEK